MQQDEKKRSFADLSKSELMEFIIVLNKCMQDYDNNIERRMNFSERTEYETIKSESVSCRSLKRIQHKRNIRR